MKTLATLILTLAFTLMALVAAQGPVRSKSDCKPMRIGAAPIQNTTSIEAFEEDPVYSEVASNATTPFGFRPAFLDLAGAYQNDETYLSYVSLGAYSTDRCGAVCAAKDGCESFNLYVLRIPALVCIFAFIYYLRLLPSSITFVYHLRLLPSSITFVYYFRLLPSSITSIYHLLLSPPSITSFYHLLLSPPSITSFYHLLLSPPSITSFYHLLLSVVELTMIM